MREVVAGLISGLVMSSVFVALGAALLITRPGILKTLARLISPKLAPAALVMPLAVMAPIAWTLIGMLLGLLYRGLVAAFPGPGLGSANGAFTLLMLAIASTASAPLPFAQPQGRLVRLLMNLAFAAIFGWVLPFFAT